MKDLIQRLLSQENGVILLSGPSNSGKTTLLKTIEPNRAGTIIVSAEQLVDKIVLQIQANGQATPTTFFTGYQCVCIEDVDWYYQREYTQFELARIISRVAERALVVITGIDLKNKMQALLSSLEYDLFEKAENADHWECREQKRVPEIYKNRKKLLRVATDMGISSAELCRLVAPMEGKTEEEKEKIAAQILRQWLPET